MLHRHPLLSLITLAYLGCVAWITLGPQPLDGREVGWMNHLLSILQQHSSTAWITYDTVEFGANIAMFVPIGLFFLLLLGRRYWWLSMMLCLVASVAIETAQLSLPTRVSDPRDILSNTAGGIAGVLVGLVLTWRPFAARPRTAEA